MPLITLLAPLLLAQVGPFPGTTKLPEGVAQDRPGRRVPRIEAQPLVLPQPQHSRLQSCLDDAAREPALAVDSARAWLAASPGSASAEPQLCLGTALTGLAQWPEAEEAFLAGRNAVGASDPALRARLGGMAGNAALTLGAAERALGQLDAAHADAVKAGDTGLAGSIALDRGRALVALKRTDEAVAALTEARTANPSDATAWLLSATLSRRLNRLDEAQRQIESAATLAPDDPEIGLEAGVIAMLSGREDAARKSWASVIAMAPNSPEARTAQSYFDQLGSPAK